MKVLWLYKKLFAQQWKETVRNPMFQKKLLVNLFMGFVFLYLLAFLLTIGISLPFFLKEIFDVAVIKGFNGLLFYTIGVGLLLRFFIQQLPLLDIKRYLHLPIKKGTLLHMVLIRTYTSFFNLVPLALILPFFFIAVIPEHSPIVAFSWLFSLLSIVAINNLLAFYLKKEFARNPWFVIAFGALLLGVFLGDYYTAFDLMAWSRASFAPFLSIPSLVLIPMGLVGVFHALLHRWIRQFLVLDGALGQRVEKVREGSDFGLSRFGNVGRLAAFELDMIRRNKKSRTFALVAFFFLLYGLIIYPNPVYEDKYSMMIFTGILITGIFMMNFGQLHFAWDSGHFDKIMTSHISLRDYILSKYLVMVASVVLMFLLSLPYAYFGPVIILAHFSAMLFNIGFGSMVLLFLAMYNRKGMSLSKSNMFNYEGVQASQFLLIPFIIVLPFLLYLLFLSFGYPLMGVGSIGVLGFIFLLLHPFFFPVLEKMLKKRKHSIAEGFRGD
ncbi:MAG: DUF5687 family protein [Flavobacteriales bacterium]